MAVKIRLQRKGRKKSPFYHIVIADSRSPRDGKFIENIGIYNPMTKPATIELDRDKAYTWLKNGAQPTETVRAILRFTGVLFKKHLLDGVAKGAHSEEQALAKWNSWLQDKEAKIRKRREQTEAEQEAVRKNLSGSVPKIVIKQDAPVEVESTEEAVEVPVDEPAAVEESPAVEAAEEVQVEAEVPAESEEVPVVEETPEAESGSEDQVTEAVAETPAVAEEAPGAEESPAEDTPAEEEKTTDEA